MLGGEVNRATNHVDTNNRVAGGPFRSLDIMKWADTQNSPHLLCSKHSNPKISSTPIDAFTSFRSQRMCVLIVATSQLNSWP